MSRYLSADHTVTALRKENVVDKKVMLYPNPAKDVLHIHGLNGNSLITVNTQGIIVKRLFVNADTYDLNISNLASSIYFLKIEGDKSITAYRFVKE